MIGLDPDERSQELPLTDREPSRPQPAHEDVETDAWDDEDWEDWLFL